MVSILKDLRDASGLSRLLELLAMRRYLFHGSRDRGEPTHLYPRIQTSSTDPDRVRGFFTPGIGLMPPRALVSYVYPNPLVAAVLALMQTEDGVCAVRLDDFSDGTAAVFFGENDVNEGQFQRFLEQIQSWDASTPVGACRVDVLERDQFPRDRLGFHMPGCYVSESAVPIVDRVVLTAGDVRALGALLKGFPPVSFKNGAHARGDPFSGIFARGGHLQFNPFNGEPVEVRVPTESDRASAITRARLRGERWLERTRGKPLYDAGRGKSRATVTPRSPFGKALKLIDDHCTEPLSIPEVARVADLSVRQFEVLFREMLGCSPREYVAERRLDLAERLISETSLSMAAISEQCGFAEQGSLTRSLKRRRGLTPMALRKLARTEDKRLRPG